MSSIAFDLTRLYRQTFGNKPYVVPAVDNKSEPNGYRIEQAKSSPLTTAAGSALSAKDMQGVDIWLPIELYNLPAGVGENGRLKLYYSTIKITGKSNIVFTSLSERKGTVKELYNVDDYDITIKGFFIDKEKRSLPEKDITALKQMHESGKAFSIYNAITDIILADSGNESFEQQQVVLTGFDLPDVEGGRKSMRPFIMSLKSDNVFTLEVE